MDYSECVYVPCVLCPSPDVIRYTVNLSVAPMISPGFWIYTFIYYHVYSNIWLVAYVVVGKSVLKHLVLLILQCVIDVIVVYILIIPPKKIYKSGEVSF